MSTSLLFDSQYSQWAFTTAVLASTTIIVYIANKRHFAPTPNVPGPKPEFLIGNFRNFLLKHQDRWSMWQEAKQYGPFVTIWLGPKRIIMVNDPDVTSEIAKNKDDYETNPVIIKVVQHLIPYSMLAVEGDEWKRHRKALNPILANPRLKFMMSKMDNTANVTIKNLKELISKTDEPIDIKAEFEDMTLDAMGYLAFGRAFRDIDGNDYSRIPQVDLSSLKKSLKVLTKEIGIRLTSYGLHNIMGDSKELRDSKNEFTKVVSIIANEYEVNRKKLSENNLEQSEWESFMDRSFIAQVLGSQDGKDFTYDELRGEMIAMILGGTDTTSSTLGYALKMLSEYPNVQEKLYEEIITVIGKDGVPQFEQLQESAMPYLDKVVKEIQRLSLLVLNLARVSTKEVAINNVAFPKGTTFWMSVAQMHRDPKYWKDPLVFMPERWDADGIANGGPVNPKAYLPFGAGQRMCFGQRLASVELRFFIVYLTRAFFFKELPPHLKDKAGEENCVQVAAYELVNVVALPVARQ